MKLYDLTVVKLLIERGSAINETDGAKIAKLWAKAYGYPEIVTYLESQILKQNLQALDNLNE